MLILTKFSPARSALYWFFIDFENTNHRFIVHKHKACRRDFRWLKLCGKCTDFELILVHKSWVLVILFECRRFALSFITSCRLVPKIYCFILSLNLYTPETLFVKPFDPVSISPFSYNVHLFRLPSYILLLVPFSYWYVSVSIRKNYSGNAIE